MAEREKILIVDDVETNRFILGLIFQDTYDVIEAANGQEAFQIIEKERNNIAVIILDIVMPILDGYGLLDKLHSDPVLSLIPVVIVTDSRDSESEIKALDCGAVDFIAKPFDNRIVKQRITNVVAKHRMEEIEAENELLREYNNARTQLETILDNLQGGVCLFEISKDIKLIYANEGYYDIIGYSKKQYQKLQNNVLLNIITDDQTDFYQSMAKYAHDMDFNRFETIYRSYDAQGNLHYHTIVAVRMPNYESKNPVFLAIISDITQLKNAEATIHQNAERLQAILDGVQGGIHMLEVFVDGTREYILCNDGYYNIFGYERSDFPNRTLPTKYVTTPEEYQKLTDCYAKIYETREDLEVVFTAKKKDGKVGYYMAKLRPFAYGDNGGYIVLTIIIDVTQEREQDLRLQYLATHDVLTGILNKTTFYEETSLMIHEFPDAQYAIVRFDIEQFKMVNEMFGVKQGDAVLKKVTEIMTGLISDGTYGRLEADVFAFCVPYNMDNITKIMNGLQKQIRRYFPICRIVFCFGIYPISTIDLEVDIMCDRASLAANHVKGNIDVHYALYDDSIRQLYRKKQDITNKMEFALQNNQFRIVIQPVIDATTGKPVSGEALVRWHQPLKGTVSPGEFVPIFEENGFIVKLDLFVCEQTCKTLRRWQEEGKKLLPISLNLSRITVYDPSFESEMMRIVNKYQIDPHYLRIEVTESVYASNDAKLINLLETLRNNNFNILMDDFGSGYSSLNVLKDAQIDILKIDMGFMTDFAKYPRAGHIVKAVIDMAKSLTLKTIAEGVETKEQFEFLREASCDMIQGYYFSRPLEVEDFEQFVAQKELRVQAIDE